MISPILREITNMMNTPLFFASTEQRRAVENMQTCRTAARGGRIVECTHCDNREIIYNPCNVRGCPSCSGRNKILWQNKLKSKLLPVSHYHLTFSIPYAFTTTWLRQKKTVTTVLFKSINKVFAGLKSETQLLFGYALTFQSHGRGMSYKPHVHCILSDGGINKEGKWEKFHQIVYSRLIERFKEITYQELLETIPSACLPNTKDIKHAEWNIYPEYHREGGKSIAGYLGHSAYGAVINLKQQFDIRENTITFTETHLGRAIDTTLETKTFVERYLNHIPPANFVTLRYYGLYSNQHTEELKKIRSHFPEESEKVEEIVVDICHICQSKMKTLLVFQGDADLNEIEEICNRSPPGRLRMRLEQIRNSL